MADGQPAKTQVNPGSGPGALYWPLDSLWVIFRPLTFYGSEIERLPLKAAVFSAAVNLAITVTIGLFGVLWFNKFPVWGRTEQIAAALAMILAWLGGLGVVVGQGFVYALAISDAKDFAEAFRRSWRLACTATAVNPLATLALVALIVHWREIERVQRDTGRWDVLAPICIGLCLVLIAWPFAMLLVGLFLDGRGRRPGPRSCGERRCEQCGYDLRVVPDEGLCPECGWPAADSFDPSRRSLPATETPGGRPRLAPRLRTYWLALSAPQRFWLDTSVRRDSRTARNLFLRTLLGSSGVFAIVFLMGFGAALRATGSLNDVSQLLALLVASAYVFAGLTAGLLVLSQTRLLICSALAGLRGNTLRHDELARIGYYGLGLPVIAEGFSATLAGLFFSGSVLALGHVARALRSGVPLAYVETIVTLLTGAGWLSLLGFFVAVAWSAARLTRAMEAARYANY